MLAALVQRDSSAWMKTLPPWRRRRSPPYKDGDTRPYTIGRASRRKRSTFNEEVVSRLFFL